MMPTTGMEINFVVTESLKALTLYESIFDLERLEVTGLPTGQNEVVFTLYGTRMHMLDENPEYQLLAPQPGQSASMWLNVLVPDLALTWERAIAAGCTALQPPTEMVEYGVSNAMFMDPFGHMWLLHQLHRIVDFETRVNLAEAAMMEGAERP